MNKITKSAWFAILKSLHDICRNTPSPSYVGMEAYNDIMNFMILRHISDNTVDEKEEYNLRNLYEKYCTDEKIEEDKKYEREAGALNNGLELCNYEKLAEILLPRMGNTSENKDIAFVKILGENMDFVNNGLARITKLFSDTNPAGGKKAQLIINKIYSDGFLTSKEEKFNLNIVPYDAVGEGFEKFMNDAGATGGNHGQFFTNYQVIEYIVDKMELKEEDIVLDPYSGSGAFLLIARKKGVKKDNIYGREWDDGIFKFLKFNTLIADINKDNVEKGDSYNYNNLLKQKGKYTKIMTNPPFGLSIDINLRSDDMDKYWSIMKSTKMQTIKDSVGLAVYSIIKSLKKDGMAGIVIDRGILNNGYNSKSWQQKLRQYIIENCDLFEILLLPKGIFTYTNFDSAVIFIKKGSKTNNIIVKQGYFEDSDKGKSNKKLFIKNLLTINYQQIIDNKFSLKIDDYVPKNIEPLYNGITYKTLGEISTLITGKYNTQDYEKYKTNNDDGINFYCGQYYSPIGKITELSYESTKPYIIFTKGGGCHTSLYSGSQGYCNSYYINSGKTAFCSVNIAFTEIKINPKYLYYVLKILKNILRKSTKFSGNLGSLQKSFIENFKISILPEEQQKRIVEFMDRVFGEDYKRLDNIVSKLKDYDLFKLLINENYEGFDDVIELYDDIVWGEQHLKRFETKYKNKLIKKYFKMYPYKVKTLKEVCEYDIGGTPLTKEAKYWNGDKLWASISDLNNNIITDTERKITDLGIKNSSVKLIKKGSIMYSFKLTIGKMGIAGDDMYCNEAIAFFNNIKLNEKYFYYCLKYLDLEKQKHLFNSQIGKALNKSTLAKLIILEPSKEAQEEIVRKIEEIDREEGEYKRGLEEIRGNIKKMYECVEQTVNDEISYKEEINYEEEDEKEENDKDEEDEKEEDEEEINYDEEDEEEEEDKIYNKKVVEEMKRYIKEKDKKMLKELMKKLGVARDDFNKKIEELIEEMNE